VKSRSNPNLETNSTERREYRCLETTGAYNGV